MYLFVLHVLTEKRKPSLYWTNEYRRQWSCFRQTIWTIEKNFDDI